MTKAMKLEQAATSKARGINKRKETIKESSMSFEFNPNKVKAVVNYNEVRQECTTYESALSYIQDRVKEFKKSGEYKWIQKIKDPNGNETLNVVANLKSMPIYWAYEETGETVDILNADGTVLETRKVIVNNSRYEVDSMDEGIAMCEALASGEVDALNERVRAASSAYKDVVEVELPAINAKAEMLYNEGPHAKGPLGAWDHKDGMGANGPVFSKEKTNKKNMYKQTARRQLGYQRYADKIQLAKG